MKAKRKRYSGTFKAKVGLEALMGVKTVGQIAREYQVHPTLVTQRKGVIKQFAVKASAYISRTELKLNASEQSVFDRLAGDGLLLEPERISLNYAIQTLRSRLQ